MLSSVDDDDDLEGLASGEVEETEAAATEGRKEKSRWLDDGFDASKVFFASPRIPGPRIGQRCSVRAEGSA